MEISPIKLSFYDDPTKELVRLQEELSLGTLIEKLEYALRTGSALDEETTFQIYEAAEKIQDLFSVSVPQALDNPTQELKGIARGYHWSKLLREKSLVSLFRFVYMVKDPSGIPFIATQINPDTGAPFDETSFIHWFCHNAAINSTTAFQRLAAYKKLIGLGFTLESAFSTIITKPYLIGSALNSLAVFDSTGKISKVDPDVAINVSQRLNPLSNEIKEIVESDTPDPEKQKDLIEAYSPIIVQAIEEISAHTNPKEASKFLDQDVLGKPQVFYVIEEGGVLVINLVERIIDESGESMEQTIRIPFIPHTTDGVPTAIIEDLIKRLPIRNRREAEMFLEKEKLDVSDIPF